MNTCYIIIPLSFCRHEPEKAVKPGVKFEEVYWENVSMQLIQMKWKTRISKSEKTHLAIIKKKGFCFI